LVPVQRLLTGLVVIWAAATLSFLLLRLLPGDAVSAQLAQSGAAQADIDRVRALMGLDAPVTLQYVRFLSGLVQGDLGYSLLNGQPVARLIMQQVQPTALLALSAIFVATNLGVLCGAIGAFENRSAALARFITNLSISVPIYWTGTLAIGIFAAQLRWLPSTGTGRLEHLILPVGVLSFHTMGVIARVAQVNIREARKAAFVQAARGRGLTERYIMTQHILRVGLLPVISVIALQTGFLLGGTVITESLFARPGIGRLLVQSTTLQDYPVVQGIVVLSAVIYVIVNTLADAFHRLFDPRIAP
jgi:peptide/nickel transport system permease protein